MTMAVALTIRGHQANQILRNNQADLNAVGRKILNNPNLPMDAALKPGGRGVPDETVMVRVGFGLDPTKKPLCVWTCRARLPSHLGPRQK
jgi:2,4-dienoyl-CoA reductase-like NADH-dependent reductase (Old Yellow Enzyme family)